jgi:acetolactate synthase regulatory subunit
MKPPPLLPDETLQRVLRVAKFDGISVLAIAGTLALASASVRDLGGAAVGLLVAAAGAIELHGAGLLKAGDRGMNWLVASQPYLAAVLLCYCAVRLTNYDPTALREAMTAELKQSLAEAGMEEDRFLRLVYAITYAVLGIGTLIYQGLMTLFYLRRREAVVAAVEAGDHLTYV